MSTTGSRNLQRFIVEGRGAFPEDMLRYDCCSFNTPEDRERAAPGAPYDETRSVRRVCLVRDIRDKHYPTGDRWRSFGWVVIADEMTTPIITWQHLMRGLDVPGHAPREEAKDVRVLVQFKLEPGSRDDLAETLRDLMRVQNENVLAVDRKRSWKPSEKAMAKAKYVKRVEHLNALLFALERAK